MWNLKLCCQFTNRGWKWNCELNLKPSNRWGKCGVSFIFGMKTGNCPVNFQIVWKWKLWFQIGLKTEYVLSISKIWKNVLSVFKYLDENRKQLTIVCQFWNYVKIGKLCSQFSNGECWKLEILLWIFKLYEIGKLCCQYGTKMGNCALKFNFKIVWTGILWCQFFKSVLKVGTCAENLQTVWNWDIVLSILDGWFPSVCHSRFELPLYTYNI